MENYSLERLLKELDDGFQIYFNYLDRKYLIYKTTENCYTQELITVHEKSPHPRLNVITKRRLKELFPFMEDIEYKSVY